MDMPRLQIINESIEKTAKETNLAHKFTYYGRTHLRARVRS